MTEYVISLVDHVTKTKTKKKPLCPRHIISFLFLMLVIVKIMTTQSKHFLHVIQKTVQLKI